MTITAVYAREILDSRGVPTLEARVQLRSGGYGVASVPSGASTGAYEAHERRDGGERMFGKGVLGAVASVNGELATALAGIDASNQRAVDEAMIILDGTPQKTRIGANAMLSVSLACARAAANARGLELYRHMGGLLACAIPCPMMNVINGGRHAGNNIDIQEFMLVPKGIDGVKARVFACAQIYRALGEVLAQAGMSVAVGDEGGYAPDLQGDEEALILLTRATERAGYRPGEDICFALDMAASEWARDDGYMPPKRGARMSREGLIDWITALVAKYPIMSVEDGLGERDFEGFAALTARIGQKCMVVGDDLFVTNPARIRMGAGMRAANAALIKPNQIGTLTETLDAIREAMSSGMRIVISHRSGDTPDDFIADLAVATGASYIKSGAPARGERVSKYNRLLAISDSI